jgi:hypothetical protein
VVTFWVAWRRRGLRLACPRAKVLQRVRESTRVRQELRSMFTTPQDCNQDYCFYEKLVDLSIDVLNIRIAVPCKYGMVIVGPWGPL